MTGFFVGRKSVRCLWRRRGRRCGEAESSSARSSGRQDTRGLPDNRETERAGRESSTTGRGSSSDKPGQMAPPHLQAQSTTSSATQLGPLKLWDAASNQHPKALSSRHAAQPLPENTTRDRCALPWHSTTGASSGRSTSRYTRAAGLAAQSRTCVTQPSRKRPEAAHDAERSSSAVVVALREKSQRSARALCGGRHVGSAAQPSEERACALVSQKRHCPRSEASARPGGEGMRNVIGVARPRTATSEPLAARSARRVSGVAAAAARASSVPADAGSA